MPGALQEIEIRTDGEKSAEVIAAKNLACNHAEVRYSIQLSVVVADRRRIHELKCAVLIDETFSAIRSFTFSHDRPVFDPIGTVKLRVGAVDGFKYPVMQQKAMAVRRIIARARQTICAYNVPVIVDTVRGSVGRVRNVDVDIGASFEQEAPADPLRATERLDLCLLQT